MRPWRSLVALTLGAFAIGTDAQTGTITDLGTTLSSESKLSTFYGLIQKYPTILMKLPLFGGVTVLAPSNAAFDRIPYTPLNQAFQDNDQDAITNVLEYHMLQGNRIAAQLLPGSPTFIPTMLTDPGWTNVTGGQRVQMVKQSGNVVVFVSGQGNRCTLTQADLMFTGGVVQVIDTLLIPPTNVTSTAESFGLTSFEGALYAAKKIDEITVAPSITMFAPSNSAFQTLGPAISSMTSDELATILDYHTLTALVYSDSLTNGTKYMTKEGHNVTILQDGNNVYVNSAQLLQTDILIANGVLHVIDNVLNPQGQDQRPNPDLPSQVPVYASASPVSDLPFTSALPCTADCPVTTTSIQPNITSKVSAKTTFRSSSSKAQAAVIAQETGLGTAGLMAILGGAVMLI